MVIINKQMFPSDVDRVIANSGLQTLMLMLEGALRSHFYFPFFIFYFFIFFSFFFRNFLKKRYQKVV